VTAKIPPGTSKSDYRLMPQHLLADRFHLVVHRETRELPVYSLVSGKGKPKVVPSSSPTGEGPRNSYGPLVVILGKTTEALAALD
jgi:uncharacterized protein (TIGR03435 family)